MGVVLDSSILVAAERQGSNARQTLLSLSSGLGNTEIALSVITLLVLAHGAARADTPERKLKREQLIEERLTSLPVHPVSAAVALRSGQIDGENLARGLRVPLSDLLIGVTALELGYGVATRNVRHFRMIPGLLVTQL
jgi:predicted nucleic acid-binding protein